MQKSRCQRAKETSELPKALKNTNLTNYRHPGADNPQHLAELPPYFAANAALTA